MRTRKHSPDGLLLELYFTYLWTDALAHHGLCLSKVIAARRLQQHPSVWDIASKSVSRISKTFLRNRRKTTPLLAQLRFSVCVGLGVHCVYVRSTFPRRSYMSSKFQPPPRQPFDTSSRPSHGPPSPFHFRFLLAVQFEQTMDFVFTKLLSLCKTNKKLKYWGLSDA